ncbi:hypothetical protein A3D70_02390 [Candidatus Adlerbacteria bacterium RIFCSPHIGHO2_02_FULL_54_18]|uniref:Uncharacterized protein n=2 Tax=Candidatus Adleribacteriota TaxID=1752736 RepID=A0A1F4Y428_9BACT|nr:MAG: hypothetical protein A2949_01950 [Candidatus Adlerbacteria bacterium RIFCSPLOWO2_01_FULL_54_21b]OGC88692.1 MAG: hypothetical protein A3D70_02390 [Candidatus Adlerbacteria bacterium RIFCSPHIGHO2_02_FULL_54_18]
MYIKVRVIAGAKKELIQEISAGHFKISVKEPALRNLANRRIVELVAMHYKVQVQKVRIVSGHRSPSKILSVPELIAR